MTIRIPFVQMGILLGAWIRFTSDGQDYVLRHWGLAVGHSFLGLSLLSRVA